MLLKKMIKVKRVKSSTFSNLLAMNRCYLYNSKTLFFNKMQKFLPNFLKLNKCLQICAPVCVAQGDDHVTGQEEV